MRRPPPISTFLNYPATAGTGLLALGLTLAWWGGVEMSALVENSFIPRGQIWRLLTSTLLHASMLHLGFNLYWLWVFGTLVEEEFGSLGMLGVMVFVGLGSSAAEFAILSGGVGLSGIGYGLFGMLWVLAARDERFAEAVDGRTVKLFVGWFFFCIATTVTGIMGVANIAHGVGAGLGVVLGWVIVQSDVMHKRKAWACAGASVFVLMIMAIWARPFVNLSVHRGEEEAWWGYEALQQERNGEAVGWYVDATRMKPEAAANWFNLGVAYHRLGDARRATAAYREAARLEPGNDKYADLLAQFEELP